MYTCVSIYVHISFGFSIHVYTHKNSFVNVNEYVFVCVYPPYMRMHTCVYGCMFICCMCESSKE